MFEQNYRVCFPKERVYICRNHQWAFAAWAFAKEAGALSESITLLHVDAHLDDTWDGVSVEGLYDMGSAEQILEVASKLEIDNFIWAGFAAQLIDHIVYVCPTAVDPSDPFDLSDWDLEGEQLQPIKRLLEQREYKGLRYDSIEQVILELSKPDKGIKEQLLNLPSTVILDLDLDVFKRNQKDPADNGLMPDEQIRKQLQFLKNLHPYDTITVALSPAFCGGDQNCRHLYQLFLDEFGLDLAKAEQW